MWEPANPLSLEEKCIRLAEASLEGGRFELPVQEGYIVVLTAEVGKTDPVLCDVTTLPITAAAALSGLDAEELFQQMRIDRGLLVALILRGPRQDQQRAISIALHRPWMSRGAECN